MTEFFNYQSPYRTGIFLELNFAELTIPLIIIGVIIYIIYRYKDRFRDNPGLDKKMRYILGTSLLVFYSSHYIFRFALYGFDTIILPFHLCGITMAFAIYLLFTNNKNVYSFVLLTGVIGSLISFMSPVIGYDSSYYRYYQFYFAHGLLLITPLYYFIVHKWYPKGKEVLNGFIILQVLALFMLLFNYINGTDFMFMFLDPAKIDKFPLIRLLGGIPYYLFSVELLGGLYFYGCYKLFSYLDKEVYTL